MKYFKLINTFLTILIPAVASLPAAAAVDWGSVEAKTVKVFYPGQASWEFLGDKDHGTGAAPVKTLKKGCAECHVGETGEFDINADAIIAGTHKKTKTGTPLEPQAIAGAKGFVDVSVQAAYDAEKIYLRLQWAGSGASVKDAALAANDKADRISVQIADKISTFRNYGCYITCHDDQDGMPANRGTKTHLYGYYTRDKGAAKDKATIDGYRSKGQFMDLWIAEFAGSEVKPVDESVLDDRTEDNNDLTATGSYENGKYTVVIERKLSTGDANDIALTDGAAFSVGIAVHDNGNGGRKHYTSFPVSIGLSTAADISAKKF
jgi:hypothetical protein